MATYTDILVDNGTANQERIIRANDSARTVQLNSDKADLVALENSAVTKQGDQTINSAEYNATGQAIVGVAKFPAKFALIATVIIAAIVIGVLVRYLSPQ